MEAEGIRLLQVLLANVVRCPSHPRTTALDGGSPVTRGRGFGNKETYTIGSHITLLRAISLLSRALVLTPSFLPWHGKGDELCHSVCSSPRRRNDKQPSLFFKFSRSADPHEGTDTPTGRKKHTTRAPRVCKEAKGKGKKLSHHGRNLSYPGQQGLTQHP